MIGLPSLRSLDGPSRYFGKSGVDGGFVKVQFLSIHETFKVEGYLPVRPRVVPGCSASPGCSGDNPPNTVPIDLP
jgi:hypothetical protein